jgi:hypothetical protein
MWLEALCSPSRIIPTTTVCVAIASLRWLETWRRIRTTRRSHVSPYRTSWRLSRQKMVLASGHRYNPSAAVRDSRRGHKTLVIK